MTMHYLTKAQIYINIYLLIFINRYLQNKSTAKNYERMILIYKSLCLTRECDLIFVVECDL